MIAAIEIFASAYLAIVLIIAGLAKIADRRSILLSPMVHQKIGIPFEYWRKVNLLVAFIEVALGFLFLNVKTLPLATLLSTSLFTSFLVLKIWLKTKSHTSDCGCYGNRYTLRADSAGIVIATVQTAIALLNAALIFNGIQSDSILRSVLALIFIGYILIFAFNQIRQAVLLRGSYKTR
jgi:hypothetical protein